MHKYKIIGIHVQNRTDQAARVQEILTKYGCNIKVRLGLHEVNQDLCSPNGVILLQIHGSCDEIMDELNSIDNVEAKKMVF